MAHLSESPQPYHSLPVDSRGTHAFAQQSHFACSKKSIASNSSSDTEQQSLQQASLNQILFFSIVRRAREITEVFIFDGN